MLKYLSGLFFFFVFTTFFSCATFPINKEITQQETIPYGELFIVTLNSPLNVINLSYIRQIQPAGFLLSKKSFTSPEVLLKTIKTLYTLNTNIPPWIMIDQEGGSVDRLKDILGRLPSQRERAKNLTQTEENQLLSTYLSAVSFFGINMNLAPVSDIDLFSHSFLKTRCFSSNINKTSEFTEVDYQAHKAIGITPVLKHFPNHGAVTNDSHLHLPLFNHSRVSAYTQDLLPYIKTKPKVIMLSHLLWTNVDSKNPCSSSKAVIDYCKKNIPSIELILTDDINMGAITKNFNITNYTIQALNSGVNLVLTTDKIKNVLELYKKVIQKADQTKMHTIIQANLKFKKEMKLKEKRELFLKSLIAEKKLIFQIQKQKKAYNLLLKKIFPNN